MNKVNGLEFLISRKTEVDFVKFFVVVNGLMSWEKARDVDNLNMKLYN